MDANFIAQVTAQVISILQNRETAKIQKPAGIPLGISNRHMHISVEDLEVLFGIGATLTKKKDLLQTGEFAAEETVTLVGPKGVLRGVRVLGPVRSKTQIELSRTDGFQLGVNPPVRDSGDIAKSPGIVIVGPKGAITLENGVICAARHVHMSLEDAACFGVSDGERVALESSGSRGVVFKEVLVRVRPGFILEMHLDTDEANAAGLKNGDLLTLARKKPS